MNKEHGQVTGLIWRGVDDLETYHQLKKYADKKGISVSNAAKQLIRQSLFNHKSVKIKEEKRHG